MYDSYMMPVDRQEVWDTAVQQYLRVRAFLFFLIPARSIIPGTFLCTSRGYTTGFFFLFLFFRGPVGAVLAYYCCKYVKYFILLCI